MSLVLVLTVFKCVSALSTCCIQKCLCSKYLHSPFLCISSVVCSIVCSKGFQFNFGIFWRLCYDIMHIICINSLPGMVGQCDPVAMTAFDLTVTI